MNPDLPKNIKKPIAILTNDYQYAQQWLFDNRDIYHFNTQSGLHTDSSNQTYLIVGEARKLRSWEILALFVIQNPDRPSLPASEMIEAQVRIR